MAIETARELGLPDDAFEIQMLHGMGEPIKAAIRGRGLRLREYAPVGELIPGMAYLVRRLLENTANDSFLRQTFVEGAAVDELIRPPRPIARLRRPGRAPAAASPRRTRTPRRHSPTTRTPTSPAVRTARRTTPRWPPFAAASAPTTRCASAARDRRRRGDSSR